MSENKRIYFLNSENLPEISEVGGKGFSLIKLSTLKLNVPNGIVLTVNFFQEWINKIKETDLYLQFIESLKDENKFENCASILNQIKEWCLSNLSLTEESKQEMEQSIKSIFPDDYNTILYAVRSSSPEEDLFGASFAGNYETYLGIQFESLEQYALKSFISCLDFRVMKYKSEKGFDVADFKIAIVIMKQIDSDVSGVGFSINPLNNDYDEVVVTSNFGLGESVVGGIVTPDEYIVNKLSKEIISTKLGTKDKVVKLNTGKNETSILTQTEENKKLSSLSEDILLQIVDNIIKIEKEYEIPIDIEFGVENNNLYILQARPITTFNKIPKELFTNENEKRQLYFDMTYAIQGLEKPMSTLGASVFKLLFKCVGNIIFNSEHFNDIRKGAADAIGGKCIFNLSNIFTKLSPDFITNFSNNINKQVTEILKSEGNKYINDEVCKELNVNKFRLLSKLPFIRIILYKLLVQSSKENFDRNSEQFKMNSEQFIKENYHSNASLLSISEKIVMDLFLLLKNNFVPLAFVGVVKGFVVINRIYDENFKDQPELRGTFNDLTKGLPYVTIIMGLELYKLTKFLDKNYYMNKKQDEFYQDFLDKKFPQEFYEKYEEFMKKYGFRGDGEFDIMNDRYYENLRVIVNQIYSSLLMNDENKNPQKDYDDANAKRPEIFQKIKSMLKNKKDVKTFEEAYNNAMNCLHYRESHKYYMIFALTKIKELILERSKILLEKNLIDDIKDIYKLNIVSLNNILENVNDYTKEKVYDQIEKDNEANIIFNTWKRTPLLFDSRGKMLSAERKKSDKKNELIGDSVSFGKIRGKAKVLNNVGEKEFYPGEILITKATDPGWTPLIINCAGIALEVGGMLQHGALVSREFNKPCVVGIDNLTNIIKDGEEVEIDAIEGVIRLLDREE